MTGSAFLPWGEIEREKLGVTNGANSLMVLGDAGADHAMRCGACGSVLYWTVRDGTYIRVPYGSLIDEPALKPTAHMFVGSKAPWHEILGFAGLLTGQPEGFRLNLPGAGINFDTPLVGLTHISIPEGESSA
jgi:hypothetical protein